MLSKCLTYILVHKHAVTYVRAGMRFSLTALLGWTCNLKPYETLDGCS